MCHRPLPNIVHSQPSATDYSFDFFTALQTKETEDDAMLGKNKPGRCVLVQHSNGRKLLSNHS